jgi:hypothetical protein
MEAPRPLPPNTPPPAADPKALLAAANSASEKVAALHIVFLAICAYILVNRLRHDRPGPPDWQGGGSILGVAHELLAAQGASRVRAIRVVAAVIRSSLRGTRFGRYVSGWKAARLTLGAPALFPILLLGTPSAAHPRRRRRSDRPPGGGRHTAGGIAAPLAPSRKGPIGQASAPRDACRSPRR